MPGTNEWLEQQLGIANFRKPVDPAPVVVLSPGAEAKGAKDGRDRRLGRQLEVDGLKEGVPARGAMRRFDQGVEPAPSRWS